MLQTISSGKGIFRIKDWWWSKAVSLMGMVYLFTAWFDIHFDQFIELALLSITTIVGFASLGYMLNDLFDLEKDAKAGKQNFMQGKSSIERVAYFSFAFLALFAPWTILPFNRISATLIVLEIILLLLYSLPPIRLKERGITGVVTDSLYAHSVPVVLAAYTFSLAANKPFPLLPISLLFVWQTLCGIRNILLHQRDDLEDDRKSGVKTFAANMTFTSFSSSVSYLLLLELSICSSFFFVIASNQLFFSISLLTILLLTVTAYYLFREKGMKQVLESSWKFFPNNLYEKWLPASYLLILSISDMRFIAILLLHVAVFNFDFYVQSFKKMYPVVRHFVLHGICFPTKRIASYSVNHFIYYFLRMFGVDLRKEQTSAVDYFKRRWERN